MNGFLGLFPKFLMFLENVENYLKPVTHDTAFIYNWYAFCLSYTKI